MEPTHPPYESGALTSPRQLQRWLDVNAQNGALTRTRYFITIPAFSIEVDWKGYSEIVGEYHYEAPNNFSFKLLNVTNLLPANPNYTLCVSYVNDDNTVVRYSIWRAVGDVMYFDVTPYANQLIKKNFRIEIWSTNVATVSDEFQTLIYTSLLGSLDYRYGTDGPLVSPDTLCEGQQSVGTVALEPFNDNTGSLSSWLVEANWTDPTWADTAGGIYGSNGSGVGQTSGNIVRLIGSRAYIGAPNTAINAVFLNFTLKSIGIEHIILSNDDALQFQVIVTATNTIQFNINDAIILETSIIPSDIEHVMYFYSSNAGLYVIIYDLLLNIIYEGTVAGARTLLAGGTFIIGDDFNAPLTGVELQTRGMVTYNYDIKTNDIDSYNQTLTYMQSLSSNAEAISIPITWGLCAQPTFNN